MINKEETREQIETAKEVSSCAEKYIREWIKNNTCTDEANNLIETIIK